MLTFATGSTMYVTEIVTQGSLWLTFGGALLAFLGGIWAFATARMRYKAEAVRLKMAELEFERSNKLGNGHPNRIVPYHHRR